MRQKTIDGFEEPARVTPARAGADARRTDVLERTLGRVALAYHLQHVMATGPSWDQCIHPLCLETKQLLPSLRLARLDRLAIDTGETQGPRVTRLVPRPPSVAQD